ncbi:GNAT family N-acetyltransferase [Chloroflexota bacterium]
MSYSTAAESFTTLERPWLDLLATCATNHVFLTPAWQKAWWQVFGCGRDLLLLSVRQDTRLMGIIPLTIQEKRVSFIGSSDVCDYMDFIAHRGEESAVFSQALDYLEAMDWDSIELHSLRPQSLALAYFVPLAKARGYPVKITQEDVSPQLVLPSSWQEYLSQLKKKERHELRRKLRRLDRTPSARFYTIREKGEVAQGMTGFLALFKLSPGEKASFMTEKMIGFFETIARSLAEEDYLRLSFLEMNGSQVASTLWLDYDNTLYLYNSAYDPAYATLSVGLLLKVFCLREGIQEGKSRFDFLRGAESYKYDLGAQDVPIYHCTISRDYAHR